MGATVLMAGVVLVVLGGAGLLGTGGASHSRMRSARPVVFVVQLVLGVLLLSSGIALLTAG